MAKTDRELLLGFIGSLSLADHLGDVANDITDVLEAMKEKKLLKDIEVLDDGEFWPGLQKALHKNGIKTLHDTSLGDD